MEDNSHAGQGAVLLDIGGTVGALVVTMPAALVGVEVEIRPAGEVVTHENPHPHSHDHGHGHDHGHDHDHAHEEDHGHGPGHRPHVAVVNRPSDGGAGAPVPSLVFPSLEEGDYELYVKPDGPVQLVATVTGGNVEFASWPE